MRTETVRIYTFAELDEHAQARAIERYREVSAAWGSDWDTDWRDSMEKFARVTDITVKDWEVRDASSHYVNWTYDTHDWRFSDIDPMHDMTGLRLRTWLINNWLPLFWKGKYYSKGRKSRYSRITGSYDDCPLTGYCADQSLIQPVLDFIEKPDNSSLADIINECFHCWARDWGADMEYQQSDEYIRENIEANEYEFYADGRMV